VTPEQRWIRNSRHNTQRYTYCHVNNIIMYNRILTMALDSREKPRRWQAANRKRGRGDSFWAHVAASIVWLYNEVLYNLLIPICCVWLHINAKLRPFWFFDEENSSSKSVIIRSISRYRHALNLKRIFPLSPLKIIRYNIIWRRTSRVS